MMSKRTLMMAVLAVGAALTSLAATDGQSIKDEMDTVVDPNTKLLAAIAQEVDPANAQAPATDIRWAQAAEAAAALKTEGHWLTLRGQARDRGLWISDAKLL